MDNTPKAAATQHGPEQHGAAGYPYIGKREAPDSDHHEADGEGSGRWLISYADLITTMMVLFLALYALELAKQRDADFRMVAMPRSTASQKHGASTAGAELDPVEAQRKQLVQLLTVLRETGRITLDENSAGVEISINAKTLFRSGDAHLLPDSVPVLEQVANALRADPGREIVVEGHTDSIPISTPQYASNWELSSARAGAVVRFLVDRGIEPHRLTAVGRADNVPVAVGKDSESLAANRRVVIFVRYGV